MKVKETIDTGVMNEYLNIRLKQYLELMKKKAMDPKTQSERYSNIMEIVSIFEFTYASMTIDNLTLIQQIKAYYKPREYRNLDVR